VTELLARLSGILPEKWRRADRMKLLRETEAPADDSPDALTTFALAMARTGQLDRAAGILEERCKLTPEYAETIEAHAEILDMVGESERARAKYETARRLRAQVRQGMPDRSFALRGRGSFLIETMSYSHASNVMKDRLLPLIARGNAYLAEGKAEAALADYEQVLKFKPGTLQALSLKGEALSMMGRYKPAAEAFTKVLDKTPNDTDALSGRAIALMARGKVAPANADWRRQLELLPARQPAARACVALRLADYDKALPELDQAVAKQPGDAYWHLYRLIAQRRLNKNEGGAVTAGLGDGWPAPLVGLLEGRAPADGVFTHATTPGRRSEALFLLGALAAARGDLADAQSRWKEIVSVGLVDLIEYAAARNELAKF
jgi:tetratricopeptide (TPR) repeat protein